MVFLLLGRDLLAVQPSHEEQLDEFKRVFGDVTSQADVEMIVKVNRALRPSADQMIGSIPSRWQRTPLRIYRGCHRRGVAPRCSNPKQCPRHGQRYWESGGITCGMNFCQRPSTSTRIMAFHPCPFSPGSFRWMVYCTGTRSGFTSPKCKVATSHSKVVTVGIHDALQ